MSDFLFARSQMAMASLMAAVALAALWWRWFALARIAVIGQASLILVGWCLAQYPDLVTPDVTIENARAPDVTLRLLTVTLGVGAMILFPAMFFLFHIFKGKQRV